MTVFGQLYLSLSNVKLSSFLSLLTLFLMVLKKFLSISVILSFFIIKVSAQQLSPAPYYLMPEQVSDGSAKLNKQTALFSPTATCNRQTIIDDYTTNYLGSAVSSAELAWTGSVGTCTAGSGSTLSETRTLQRINYFRKLVGLQDNITFDQTSYRAGCQATSLIMDAQNALSHFPPNTWSCWTQTGYDYAGLTNIALGIFASSAITGYIQDNGSGNEPTGHRRWVFYSRASVFGTGSTYDNGGANALRVHDVPLNNSPVLPNFIAYPSEGYFPRSLMFTRWSFGIPSADFSSATVSVTNEAGSAIAITQHAYVTGYGDNTITWEMPSNVIPSSGDADVVFNVTVSGITSAPQSSYTYKVIAIKEATPTTVITPTHPTCGNNGSATVAFSAGAKSYLWSNGSTSASISNVGIGNYTVTVTDKNDCTYSESINLTDNSSAVIAPGSATPSSMVAGNSGTSAVTLNLSTTGSTNVTTGKIVGWWITTDNPITTTVTNQTTLNAALAAALVEPSSVATSNTSFMYKSTSGSSLSKTYTCGTQLNSTKTYYATPFVSDYLPAIADATCTSSSGSVNDIPFNSQPGKYTSISPTAITCKPSSVTIPPTYTLTITVSGYTGAPNQLGLAIYKDGLNNSMYVSFTLTGNGTYSFNNTSSGFSGYDPGTPGGSTGLTAVAWQQSGLGMSSGSISMSLNITYPGSSGTPFPTVNYSSCAFGTPKQFSCATALPVELLYLKGKTDGKVNTLTWATASEKDNDYFELQRSQDGILFETLAKVPGAGTSTETRHYSMVDNSFVLPTNYYRLIQTDYDGKQAYSEVISISRDKKANLSIYPNPTNSTVHIATGNDSEEQIEVSNLMGEVVLKAIFSNATTIDLTPFSAGIYIIRTSSGVVQRIAKY